LDDIYVDDEYGVTEETLLHELEHWFQKHGGFVESDKDLEKRKELKEHPRKKDYVQLESEWPSYRRQVELWVNEGWSDKDIASLLNVPLPMVKKMIEDMWVHKEGSEKRAVEIGTAEAVVTVDVPIDATQHSMVRLTRPGSIPVEEEEITQAVQKAASEIIDEFLSTGQSEYAVYDETTNLNVVLAIKDPGRGSPIEFKVITVMKKEDFVPYSSTKLIRVASFLKKSYVKHVPGHKSSDGESRPWCVFKHGTDKRLSCYKTEEDANKALQHMHIFKNSSIEIVSKKSIVPQLLSLVPRELRDQCHSAVSDIEESVDVLPHLKSRLEFVYWPEDRWSELAKKIEPSRFRNQIIREMLEDIVDGSVNGHSFVLDKGSGHYVDPFLHYQGVGQEDIDDVDSYLYGLYKK